MGKQMVYDAVVKFVPDTSNVEKVQFIRAGRMEATSSAIRDFFFFEFLCFQLAILKIQLTIFKLS